MSCLVHFLNAHHFPLPGGLCAVSFSSSSAAAAGFVKLLPVDFTLSSYRYVLAKPEFMCAMLVSGERLALGVVINMVLTVLVAYPLSHEKTAFRHRSLYTWFFLVTILFSGGLVPAYMAMRNYGILDSIWVLVLPTAVPVFNVVLLMNFFRELPREIEEAAFMNGAPQWYCLWKIYVPLSTPALATLVLFISVFHWNSWFDGLLFMNSPVGFAFDPPICSWKVSATDAAKPVFHKEFLVSGKVEKARLYITGLGGRTENFGSEFRLLAELILTYTNASEEIISSDETWEYRGSQPMSFRS